MKKKCTAPHKSLEDYLVKPGEQSPYANLLIDLAFKKAFDPDKPASCENLVNLLNDLLAPQLKRPIKNVWTRNVAKNLSGSKVSRTAIFDLHCVDDADELIEIEVQIRELDNFLKRLAFYASELVANQAEPGDWDYNVKPTGACPGLVPGSLRLRNIAYLRTTTESFIVQRPWTWKQVSRL